MYNVYKTISIKYSHYYLIWAARSGWGGPE